MHEPEPLGPGRRGRGQEPRRAVEELGGRALGAPRLGAADRVPADEALVAARGRADTGRFVEPTSVTVQPSGARSRTARTVDASSPTGTAAITSSAPATARRG